MLRYSNKTEKYLCSSAPVVCSATCKEITQQWLNTELQTDHLLNALLNFTKFKVYILQVHLLELNERKRT